MTVKFQSFVAALARTESIARAWVNARLVQGLNQQVSRQHCDPAPQARRGSYLGMLSSLN